MSREVTGRRQDQVEYVTYMDAVATEIGCKPNIGESPSRYRCAHVKGIIQPFSLVDIYGSSLGFRIIY